MIDIGKKIKKPITPECDLWLRKENLCTLNIDYYSGNDYFTTLENVPRIHNSALKFVYTVAKHG